MGKLAIVLSIITVLIIIYFVFLNEKNTNNTNDVPVNNEPAPEPPPKGNAVPMRYNGIIII